MKYSCFTIDFHDVTTTLQGAADLFDGIPLGGPCIRLEYREDNRFEKVIHFLSQ